MTREIYLDNAATTKVHPEVVEIMVKAMEEDYGNPSSLHRKGAEAERLIRHACEQIAHTLRIREKEIIFTSGGTESNNLAIIGAAMARRREGKHLITTVFEHASAANPFSFLEKEGFEVTRVPVSKEGIVDPEEIAAAIRPDTLLVSVMMVNNEIGSVQPVAEIGRLIKERNPKTLFHVDAIQGYGKFVIRPHKENIDMLSVSGHKIHGPKGSGFLYVSENARIVPILFGGGQQNDMRSGTENVPGILGLGKACELIYTDHAEKMSWLYELKLRLTEGLEKLEGVRVNGPKVTVQEDVPAEIVEKYGRHDLPDTEHPEHRPDAAPQIVSASFDGVRSEVLLHALEDQGIMVSAGSACSSNGQRHKSATLTAIGLEEPWLSGTIRFSFGIYNTEEDVEETLAVLSELLPRLRRFVRR